MQGGAERGRGKSTLSVYSFCSLTSAIKFHFGVYFMFVNSEISIKKKESAAWAVIYPVENGIPCQLAKRVVCSDIKQ